MISIRNSPIKNNLQIWNLSQFIENIKISIQYDSDYDSKLKNKLIPLYQHKQFLKSLYIGGKYKCNDIPFLFDSDILKEVKLNINNECKGRHRKKHKYKCYSDL